ncbi:MAG: hypothetical protein NTV88_02910 [Candidatus Micrarchaeota archaeon]|nr:hypothetical protein [Candidatus Micrarchaeota archaeon]
MAPPAQAPDPLDKAWRSTCRVLFGSEVGPLSDFEEWLSEYDEKIRTEKSALSGKSVSFSQNEYNKGARFITFDEVDLGKKFQPLSINEVKDIDSIVSAVQERIFYTGNVILGHSSSVENSSNVVNSHYVKSSTVISDCKYIACSRYVKYSECCFGLLGAEKNTHVVRTTGSELKRCFECNMAELLSDCYYCAKVQNSHDCFFCFGTHNSAYQIGNTPLPKDKYAAIKAKLCGEIAEKLKKDKRIFSLLTLIEKASSHAVDKRLKFEPEPQQKFDGSPIETAFSKTMSILFGRILQGIGNYSKFLQKHIPPNMEFKSPLSNRPSIACNYRIHLLKKFKFGSRMPAEEEMIWVGKNSGLTDLSGEISMDLGELVERLHPVAYTNLDKVAGNNRNFTRAPVMIDAQDCMDGAAYIRSKKCAYCFWASGTEASFGSYVSLDSSFVMKNFYCEKMQRAFECDGCNGCADAYYLHNCENVRESMFCFNAKNLSYAIGNAALPPDKYRGIKKAVVAQLADELERNHDIKLDIFNIGAAGKRG